MNLYILHSIGTNHNRHDDVAITEAISIEEAITKFKRYYINVNKQNVKLIDIYPKSKNGINYVQGIQIVSTY